MNKLPPIEKIPEAYSAIVDSRVFMQEGSAEVHSSDGRKVYTVSWEGNSYYSNDSATYWQGYAGYPILAVLMLQGKLPLDMDVAAHFAGINWTELNKRHKRNYTEALAEVLDRLQVGGVDTVGIEKEIERVYGAIPGLSIAIKRGKKR